MPASLDPRLMAYRTALCLDSMSKGGACVSPKKLLRNWERNFHLINKVNNACLDLLACWWDLSATYFISTSRVTKNATKCENLKRFWVWPMILWIGDEHSTASFDTLKLLVSEWFGEVSFLLDRAPATYSVTCSLCWVWHSVFKCFSLLTLQNLLSHRASTGPKWLLRVVLTSALWIVILGVQDISWHVVCIQAFLCWVRAEICLQGRNVCCQSCVYPPCFDWWSIPHRQTNYLQ